MRRLLLRLLIGGSFVGVLPGCKSAEKVLFKTETAGFCNRLPALELAVDMGPLMATEGALPEDPGTLFEREMNQNVLERADSASTKFGYAKLQVTEASVTRTGKGFQALQMLTLMTPSILGVPLENYSTNVKAELQIMDAQGEVIGTYVGAGRSSVRVAAYYGYSQTAAPRLSDVDALRQALSQIRPQLDSDSKRLREKLLAAGPVEDLAGGQ